MPSPCLQNASARFAARTSKRPGSVRARAARHSRPKPCPGAWQDWCAATGRPLPAATGQSLEHFYFSLQAAIAGLGVAIGPWHLVQDDINHGLLVAPLGFVEDGSQYRLLSPHALLPGSVQHHLLAWLRSMA